MAMRKRVLAVALAVVMAFGVLAAGALADGFTRIRTYTPGQFTDVAESAWYAPYVKDAYELGLMGGTSDNTFSPSGMFTVAQALTVAGRLHSLYNGGDGNIPGTTGDWQKDALQYCVASGIVAKGRFDNFYRNATRAEMAEIIEAALPESAWGAIRPVDKLPDVSSATEGYQAIMRLYEAGIFSGSDDYGTFSPYAFITRAEVAAIVARCADPTQRQTGEIKKPDTSAVKISEQHNMSNGRMLYKDAETGLVGFIDGAGKAVIPAKYYEALDFADGYAPVRAGQDYETWGLIDTSGNMVVPAQYRSISYVKDGVFQIYKDGKYAAAVNGTVKTGFDYESIKTNGVYIIGTIRNGGCDIFDMNGVKLGHFDDAVSFVEGSPLLAVYSGGKYALARGDKAITQFLFDSISLYENADMAVLKSGSLQALAGENGIIFNLGEYTYKDINGGYACVKKTDGSAEPYAVADATGKLSQFFTDAAFAGEAIVRDVSDKGVVLEMAGDEIRWVIDAVTGEISKPVESKWGGGFANYALMEDGSGYLYDGTKVDSIVKFNEGKSDSALAYELYDDYVAYEIDGKYGLVYKADTVLDPVYDTPEDAINAFDFYQRVRENGKYVVKVGNDVKGFDYAIRYFGMEGIFYDNLTDVGEGYYVGQFGNDLYLIHA